MNNKALTMSLAMAILAVFFVESYITSIEDEAKRKFGTAVLVVVANRDINEMETITEVMLEFKSIPKKFMEPSSISSELDQNTSEGPIGKDKIKGLKGVIGTISLVPIKKGEQLTYNKITEAGIRTGLASQITPGRRAVSVPVTESSSVSKLIKPGDRVDVIAILDSGAGKESRVSKTILQDVLILSIGRYINNNVARVIELDPFGSKDRVKSLAEDFSYSSITLEVEPLQAQALALITSNGDNTLSFSLRNNDDVDRLNVAATSMTDVIGVDASKLKMGAQLKK